MKKIYKRANDNKAKLLGMPQGTAANRLRKMIMFKFVKELELDNCYMCNKKITDIKTFTIEHKETWQDKSNPAESFFDLDNIAFSHAKCNVRRTIRDHPDGGAVLCPFCHKKRFVSQSQYYKIKARKRKTKCKECIKQK